MLYSALCSIVQIATDYRVPYRSRNLAKLPSRGGRS